MLVRTNRRSPAGVGADLLGLRNRLTWFLDDPAWFATQAADSNVTTWMPPLDAYEDGETYQIVTELPGIARENLNLSLENNVLTIRGHKPLPTYAQKRIYRQERAFGNFERSFTLPSEVDADAVQASYEDGILTITCVKPERARAREIPVNVTNGTRHNSEN